MTPPSPKQEKILRFIDAYIREHGMPPTLKDMARHLGAKSPTAPLDIIKALAKKGYVRRRAFASRGTVLTPEGQCLARDIILRGQLG